VAVISATAEKTSFQTILYDTCSFTARITLNRSTVLNALNALAVEELTLAFQMARADPEIRGVILTGAGDRSFIAGADISEIAQATAVEAERNARAGQELMNLIEDLGKPVVAAVNGLALGELACQSKDVPAAIHLFKMTGGIRGTIRPRPHRVRRTEYRIDMPEAVIKSSQGDIAKAVPRLFVLGLNDGRIHSMNTDGSDHRTVVTGCHLPDGIVVDVEAGHIYWTNMGVPNRNDGSIERADIEHFFQQFTGPMTAWWKVLGSPQLTPEVQKKHIDGVHAEAGSRSIDELEAERDEVLLGLIELRNKVAESSQTKSAVPVA
jgi:hypothetical protein